MTIVFRTQEFPTEPEGDLVLCNGQPGSAVAHWLRAVLSDQDIKTGEPIQEDYGWGFWLDDPTAVWVAVSYAGGDQTDPDDAPLWYVSISHETPIFTPRQWFRRQQGRAWVNQVFAVLQDAISHHTGIMIEAIEKRGNHD